MERLGLGAREATERDPRPDLLLAARLRRDDPRAAMPAWEGVIGAATGIYLPAGEAALHRGPDLLDLRRDRRAPSRSSWR